MLRNDSTVGVAVLVRRWESELAAARERYAESGETENGLVFPPHPAMGDHAHPFDTVAWSVGPVNIKDESGKIIFTEDNAEFPQSWAERDRQVVASKYFFGDHDQGFRETSYRQVVVRVSCTIALWALESGTFRNPDDAENFLNYLMMIQLHQEFAFNSPVYFNVGVHCYGLDPSPENYIWVEETGLDGRGSVIPCHDANTHPQISACLPYDGMVNTDHGLIPIGDIVAGLRSGISYRTFDRDGKPTQIKAGVCSGKRFLVSVALEDGTVLRLTSDHRVFVRTPAGVVEKCAGDLTIGTDRLVLGRHALMGDGEYPVLGPFPMTADLSWVAGVMVGNGFSGRPPSATSDTWEVKINTRAEADRVRKVMDLHQIPYMEKEFHWGYMIRGYGSAGRAFWKAIDLWNHTSAKVIPEWVMRAPADIVGSFLNGLFGTDGHVIEADNDRVTIGFSNVSEDVSRKAHVLLRSLGIFGSLSGFQDQRTESDRRFCWTICVADQKSVGLFAERIGFTHEAKAAKLAGRRPVGPKDYRTDDVLVVGRAKAGAELVYDIQTESGTFWYEGVLVHNCFIQKVEDNMASIMRLATSEAMLFKRGSGTGTDLSTLRSSREHLSCGGTASGPVSFMAMYDRIAAIVKSGGRSRRAAKMQTLKYWHPDIFEFVECKPEMERMARTLIRNGYDANFNSLVYSTVLYQNANLSVRVDDSLMNAALDGGSFETYAITTRKVMGTYSADSLLEAVAEASHECGDPALQFEDTIQRWHTCPKHEPINSSNPCFTDDTLVDTSEGKISIGKLAAMHAAGEGLPYAFAFDRVTGVPALRKIRRAWCTGQTRRLVKVETDKGLTFRCTPEHEFLTYGGAYVQAQDLKPGTRLRKIGRHVYPNGRSKIILPGKAAAVWQHRWMWEQVHGPIPEGMEVHHSNDDGADDRLSNLELLEAGHHQARHLAGTRNPRYMRRNVALILETWERLMDGRPGIPSSATWNRFVQANGLTGQVPQFSGNTRKYEGQTWGDFVAWVADQRDAVNDKIRSVEPVCGVIDGTYVYDLEVEDTHNFSVTNNGSTHSIVVHNCSEYMFIDDSACNLASLNVARFLVVTDGGRWAWNIDHLHNTCRVACVAMDTMVDRGSYPTPEIALNSHRFRPLGGGYCNLGALLMIRGIPYDSPGGRLLAAALASAITGSFYLTSAYLSRRFGPFDAYPANSTDMLNVMEMHRNNINDQISCHENEPHRGLWHADDKLFENIRYIWNSAIYMGKQYGYRNSQATNIAPTGTIGYAMGCDTLGIEPEIALVRYKRLAGGGVLKLVNNVVPAALLTLRYNLESREHIQEHMEKYGTIEDIVCEDTGEIVPSGLRPEHLPVFDCAFPPAAGEIGGRKFRPREGRFISPHGHVRMIGQATGCVSGAISKTVNVPKEYTVQNIKDIYFEAWRSGCKSISVFRDGSKGDQPVTTSAPGAVVVAETPAPVAVPAPLSSRFRMPDDRTATIHKFNIMGHEGFIVVGYMPDGRPGEVFIEVAKQGSTVGGLMGVIGTLISILLQHHVPMSKVVEKLAGQNFEPRGITKNIDIRFCKSIVDYVGQYLGIRFVPGFQAGKNPLRADGATPAASSGPDALEESLPNPLAGYVANLNGSICSACGEIMVRVGQNCEICSCGHTEGGCGA